MKFALALLMLSGFAASAETLAYLPTTTIHLSSCPSASEAQQALTTVGLVNCGTKLALRPLIVKVLACAGTYTKANDMQQAMTDSRVSQNAAISALNDIQNICGADN